MSSKKRKNGICVYCGRQGRVTDHHIPPKNLFSEDDRTNLIKVPSCESCNNQASKDDEYFRLVLTLREDVRNHPDVKAVLPIAMRSLRRPEASIFRANFIKGLKRIHPTTPSGLILPVRGAYTLDLMRIERVLQRLTKGLFFHLKGYRLPNDYSVSIFAPFTMRNLAWETVQWFAENVLEPLGKQTGIVVGRKVFLYKFLFTDSDPSSSIWLYLFYERVVFFALTGQSGSSGEKVGSIGQHTA